MGSYFAKPSTSSDLEMSIGGGDGCLEELVALGGGMMSDLFGRD